MDELKPDEPDDQPDASPDEPDALGEAARSLIALAADEAPPVGFEDESWGMVVSRIDELSRGAPIAPAAAPVSGSARWVGAAILITALGAVVGLGVWVVLSGPPPRSDGPAKSDRGHHGAVPAKSTDTAKSPASGAATTSETAVKSPTNGAATDPVAIAKLLDDAEAALVAADGARALELLERHAAAAPVDALQRRLALRIRALCALDRRADARSEAAAFLERHGSSQWAADVRSSCAGTD